MSDLQTTLIWGPNRYSESAVMCVDLELAGSKNSKRAVEFVASRAAELVATALEVPARAIAVAGEPMAAVFEVPVHSVGRFAALEAMSLWSEGERDRREKWPLALARAKQWASGPERRLAKLLVWARERDLPVRPAEIPERWSIGDGRLSTTVSLASPDAGLQARLNAQVEAETIGRLPAVVIGGEYGKTACARLITRALLSWGLEPELIGDTDLDDASSPSTTRRLSPHTLMAVIESPKRVDVRNRTPYPDYHTYLTVILGSDGPGPVKARYEHALMLARRTLPGGTLVLSVDDEIGRRLAQTLRKTDVNIIRVTARARAAERPSAHYSLIDGHLVVASKPQRPLLSVSGFGTVGGWPSSYGLSLVAAFAALDALEARPQKEVTETLTRFYPAALGAGCFGLHLVRGARVLVHRANSLEAHRRLCDEVRALVQRLGVDTVRAFVEPPPAASKAKTNAILSVYRRSGAKVTLASPKADGQVSQVESSVNRAKPAGLIVVAAPKVEHLTAWCRKLAVAAPIRFARSEGSK